MHIKREQMVEITFFLLRIVAGLLFLQAGGMKLFGWFGGLPGGMELNTLMLVAGILEFFGGIAIFFGLATRPVAFILSGQMAVAYFIGHFPSGFLPIQNHGELAVLLCFIFLFFAAYGGGKWSLDEIISQRRIKST